MRLVDQINSDEAIATIRMIFADKTRLLEGTGAVSDWSMATGIGTLAYDRGSEFAAFETTRAVTGTGGSPSHTPKGMPWFRGAGERIFLTVERRFMGHFAGRTFSNVVERGDYPSERKANIALDVLARMLVRHVVDDYHNRPHQGLGGETPLNAWNRLVKLTGRIPLPDTNMQRHIFGIEHIATLDKSGVELLGLRFASKDIHRRFLQVGESEVRVKLDPADIGCISLQFGNEWFNVPNVKRDLRGVSLRAWIDTATALGARFKKEAELSRQIVLDALRDNEALAREYQREAGISEELETPAEVERAIRHMGLSFRLPSWDEDTPVNDPNYDLLDDVIPVSGAADMIAGPVETQPTDESPDEAASWQMGDRKEGTP